MNRSFLAKFWPFFGVLSLHLCSCRLILEPDDLAPAPDASSQDLGFSADAGFLIGDIDRDGCVDDEDLAILLSDFEQTEFSTRTDLNGDGRVNQIDLSLLLSEFGDGPMCPPDAGVHPDATVRDSGTDPPDLGVDFDAGEPADSGSRSRSDINGDGCVDDADIQIVTDDYGSMNAFGHPADLNDDGLIDISDLGIVLGDYGEGCTG